MESWLRRIILVAAVAEATTHFDRAQAATTSGISEVWHIHGIAVDPQNPYRLYLATHYGLFLTSSDGTATAVSDSTNDYMGFTVDPGDPNVLFASGHPSGGGNLGVTISRDAGKSWSPLSRGANGPVDFHSLTASRADPNVLYGLSSDIQISRDRGATWKVTGSPAAEIFDIAASASFPAVVYAATRGGVMVSRDFGRSWQTSENDGPATMVQTAKDGSVYAFVLGSGLLKKLRDGEKWIPVSNNFDQRVLVRCAIDSTNADRMFAVTEASQILASKDGGKTWNPLAAE